VPFGITGYVDFSSNQTVGGNKTWTGNSSFTSCTTGVNGVYNALCYPGAPDLGAQINAAIAAAGSSTKATIFIPAGSYTLSTTVNYDPLYTSIVGDGQQSTIITCNIAAICFNGVEATFTILPGGTISEFSLFGNGAAHQVGIQIGGVIEYKLHNLYITGFTGGVVGGSGATTPSIGLLFNNSASGNGWMERTDVRNVRLDNDTIGWQFQFNTSNAMAISFGYSNLDATFQVLSGQIGVNMVSGRLYHSKIHWIFNGATGANSMINVAFNTAGSDMDSNEYAIFGEGPSGVTAINVASGATFDGYGVVDFGSMFSVNANSPSALPTLRVLPFNPAGVATVNRGQAASDFGAIANFMGTGNSANAFPAINLATATNYANFGLLSGANISSPFVSMYSFPGNAFPIFTCPSGSFAGIGACTQVASVDTNGSAILNGSLRVGGGSTVSKFLKGSGLSLNSAFTAITAGTCQVQTLTLSGAATTGVVTVNPTASLGTGFSIGYSWVSSANTISVNVCSGTTGTPTSVTYNASVIQ
jgi:hypothetical protein